MATQAQPLQAAPLPRLRMVAAQKLLLALLLCLQAGLCWTARGKSLQGQVDLRAFYSAGTLVRAGHADQIYDDRAEEQTQQALFHDGARTLHFLYPVFAALPCVLLVAVPYWAAFLVVSLADLLLLYLCAALLRREHPEWRCSAPLLFAASLLFLPSAIALMQGQISFLLLMIFTVAYVLERRGRPGLAGLCLSLALVKFQIALPVVALYACWRKWKLLRGFAAGGVVLLAVSLVLAGAPGLHAYADRLHGVGSATLLHPGSAHLRYGMEVAKEPNLHGFVTGVLGHGNASRVCTVAVTVLILLASLLRGERTIATALPAALLVSYHMQPYDLLLLLLPLCLLAGPLAAGTSEIAATQGAVPLTLLAAALLLTPPVGYYLQLRGSTSWFMFACLCVLAASMLRHGDGTGVPQPCIASAA